MRIASGITAVLVALPLSLAPFAQAPESDRYWPQWRGPLANGISRTANPPIEGREKSNVRWKVEIRGGGSASPVIWGARVFVLTAIPAGPTVANSHAPRGGVN